MNLNRIILNNCLRPNINSFYNESKTRNVCKIAVTVHPPLVEKFEKNELKHRHHPGIVKAGNSSVPKYILEAITRAIGDFPVKTLVRDGKALNQYINARHPPPEVVQIQTKIKEITVELDAMYPIPSDPELSEEELKKIKYTRQQKLQKILKERTFAWKPITYGTYEALVYAVARSAREYAILTSIFKEIQTRQPEFKPRSFLDFGSGVGTAMWTASNLWKDSIFEYLNVDASREMNDLSELIMRGGNENQQLSLRNVHYRQFLPSIDTKYDLVVSSFSLFELPSAKDRQEVIYNLWKKCDGYLVVVEEGTRKASELVNEVRSNVIGLKDVNLVGHVFSPCPHNLPCPRLATEGDKTPCNFAINYEPLGLGEKNTGRNSARFTYVVLRKGPKRNASDSWPRIVRPTLVRSKHTVCRMCTSKGVLQEIVFTESKHGRDAFRCARSSEWGDRLPIEIGAEWESETRWKKKHAQLGAKTETVELP